MKTRIIQTKFWEDDFVFNLNAKEKLFFIYLFTNPRIGLTGIYELTDSRIKFDLGLTQPELDSAKSNLQKSGKFYFDKGWVVTINANKYNNYCSNSKLKKAYNKELFSLPEHLRKFAETIDSEPYSPSYVQVGSSYKHIVVAESYLGRKLEENEVVHHLDKNPSNNDPHNLAIMDKEKHNDFHSGVLALKDTSMILVSDYLDTPINNKSKIINNKNIFTNNNTQIELIKINEKKHSKITDITETDFEDIATSQKVSVQSVRSSYEDLVNYCEAHGKTYLNYRSALVTFVKNDIKKGVSNGRPKIAVMPDQVNS